MFSHFLKRLTVDEVKLIARSFQRLPQRNATLPPLAFFIQKTGAKETTQVCVVITIPDGFLSKLKDSL